MARLTLVFVVSSVLLIFRVGAFPFVENEAVVAGQGKGRLSVEMLTAETNQACKRQGGLCVTKNQCPKDKLSSKVDICGADRECCHSLPDTIVDCEERGGICRPSSECKGGLREPLGRCVAGHVCCILII